MRLRPLAAATAAALLVPLAIAADASGSSPLAVRVDAGGTGHTERGGVVWASDRGFTGGRTARSTAAVAGTDEDLLYGTRRVGATAFEAAVPAGRYRVRLLFAEMQAVDPGERVFDVRAEGALIADDLDVAAAVGRRAAHEVVRTVDVRDGQLSLQFAAVRGRTLVSAVEVVAEAGAPTTTSAPTTTTAPTTTLAPTTTAPTTTAPTTTAPPPPPPPGGTTVRMDVGGPGRTDSQGRVWTADACSSSKDFTSPNPIAGTVDDALFQSRAFHPVCRLPLPAGRYEVTLGWAETYDGASGAGYRVFDVVLEGRVAARIDVLSAVARDTAYLRTFTVDVTDGALDLSTVARASTPMLSTLEVVPTGSGPTTTAPPPPTTTPPTTAPSTTAPASTTPTTSPPGTGALRTVPSAQHPTLQSALDAAQPGDTVRVVSALRASTGTVTRRAGQSGRPITITMAEGASLDCGSSEGRCLQIGHSWYEIRGVDIRGGNSNLYLQGLVAGSYVTDVKVLDSRFGPAAGECIRVKYQASDVEIARNVVGRAGAECGKGRYGVSGSKNGEGIYIGTAPEQLAEKNPSPEIDRTTRVHVHHNDCTTLNECVDIKEGAELNLVEHNVSRGQLDPNSAAFDTRSNRNTFRWNTVEDAQGACFRAGGDTSAWGLSNDFYGNTCRDVAGYGVKYMNLPQGRVCGNTFSPTPGDGLRNDSRGPDPTAPCPA